MRFGTTMELHGVGTTGVRSLPSRLVVPMTSAPSSGDGALIMRAQSGAA
jgi:hypothetical protein